MLRDMAAAAAAAAAGKVPCFAGGREGGLFTIEIAEEDRPRRSRANRTLSSGRTVSPTTKECC
jgi:hypothetical protein